MSFSTCRNHSGQYVSYLGCYFRFDAFKVFSHYLSKWGSVVLHLHPGLLLCCVTCHCHCHCHCHCGVTLLLPLVIVVLLNHCHLLLQCWFVVGAPQTI